MTKQDIMPNEASTTTALLKVTADRATSARELHAFLGVETRFNDWFNRMKEYGFTEGVDYTEVLLKNEYNPQGGRPSTDYALTLDTAKEISMIQRSEKGKQARQYFIQCERQLREAVTTLPQRPFVGMKILEQNLETTNIKIDGKTITAIVHPDYGHLFNVHSVARFFDTTVIAIKRRKQTYKNSLREGIDFHYLFVSHGIMGCKETFYTEQGLATIKDCAKIIRVKAGQTPSQPLSKTTTDNTLDLLMQIEDKTIRTSLFENLKNRGII